MTASVAPASAVPAAPAPAAHPPRRPVRARVLYTRYPHWGTHSGMTQLARWLDPRWAAVTLHGASDDDADFPLPRTALGERLRARLRARVQAGGMAWYKLSDLAAELRALPAALSGRADVVHFLDAEHSAQYLPALLGRMPARRARTLATYHQPPHLLGGLVDRRVVARLDHVTVVSPTQLEWFRAALPAERVQVMLHGVDAEFFVPAPPGARAAGPFRCITVGHWMRDWAAVRAVAERLAGHLDVEFHVVTSRATGLESLANVVHHRDVDDVTLRRLYQSADVLFLPLTEATANNALLEGIACGLPVVSTDLESVRAYLAGCEAALVAGNAPGALADALCWLRDDAPARLAAGRRARARAEALSWRAVAPAYARLYARLTEGR